MEIRFNVTGTTRKALVTEVSEIIGEKPVYKAAPTFAYEVGSYSIDKNGALTGEVTQELLSALAEKGFIAPDSIRPTETPNTLCIEFPKDGFTETAVDNLRRLVASKAVLIKKAIATDCLPIEETDETLCFPWFPADISGDEVSTYTQFITALCTMVKGQKCVIAKPKEVDNEKYAFRCFLLRLGFIGEEYAVARKILLAKLSGNGAFKNGVRIKDVSKSD